MEQKFSHKLSYVSTGLFLGLGETDLFFCTVFFWVFPFLLWCWLWSLHLVVIVEDWESHTGCWGIMRNLSPHNVAEVQVWVSACSRELLSCYHTLSLDEMWLMPFTQAVKIFFYETGNQENKVFLKIILIFHVSRDQFQWKNSHETKEHWDKVQPWCFI